MSRIFSISLFFCFLAGPVWGSIIGEPKKPYQDRPEDVPCKHVETIAETGHEYSIRFNGRVDGTMTRMPIGYAAFAQGWQPNRSVLIENVGTNDVKNPRLVVNGKLDWHTLESIVAEATRGYTTPGDKARAIWEFVRRQRFHACTWDGECSDALKALNVYGYTLCGNQARVLTDLWRTAGLKTRRCYPIGHVVSEVFYDGRYHMLDSDEHVLCLLRDNQTIASAEQIVRDHDLVKRTHTYGIGRADSRKTDQFSASLYSHEGKREGEFPPATRHSMELTLRPCESIEFRWDHIGKQYSAGIALKKGQKRRDGLGDLLAGWGTTAYDNLRNGKLRYRPDLSSPLAKQGAESSQNVTFDAEAGRLKLTAPDKGGFVTWKFACPYVFVGGRAVATLQTHSGAAAQWRYSTDGKTWTELAASGQFDSGDVATSLDEIISPRRHPTYRFWLQLSLHGDVTVTRIAFEHDIQTAALSLPELTVGDNRVAYRDACSDKRQVRITHQWLERTCWHAPEPPADAIAPKDGATVEGTRVMFRWSDAMDPDGDKIVDYHFELSAHADMRWPLSPNFEKRLSLTGSKGKPQWLAPDVGVLNPDTDYYWHVRALDATGVWGPWSRTFRFRTAAPGVPLDVTLTPDSSGFTLTWRPNPQGRTPVAYKVYGSDEKGFSASDTAYPVLRGKGFVRTIEQFMAKPADADDAGVVQTRANLITQLAATQLPVVGPKLTLPNTNKAFYRVVAVDTHGNESGPSEYAEVPRPFVYSDPPSPAKAAPPTDTR